MKKTLLVMAMAIALAMSMMGAAFADISSPSDGDMVVADVLQLRASEPDANEEGEGAWAVRSAVDNPECETGVTPDLAGWRGGTLNDDVISVDWDGSSFEADINVSEWERGEYCFAFNPEPFNEYRDFVTFTLATPESKDACKDGGWMTFGDYKNQGECVSEFARAR